MTRCTQDDAASPHVAYEAIDSSTTACEPRAPNDAQPQSRPGTKKYSTVKAMGAFWEKRVQQEEKTKARAKSVDESCQRHSLSCSRRDSTASAACRHRLSDSGLLGHVGESGGAVGRSHRASRHMTSMRQTLSDNMETQLKLKAQIDERMQKFGDGECVDFSSPQSFMSRRSNGSGLEEAVLEQEEEDAAVAELKIFEETSRSLWQAQRKQMRMLLHYVEVNEEARLRQDAVENVKINGNAYGNLPHGDKNASGLCNVSATSEPEPHEPAGEPDADESIDPSFTTSYILRGALDLPGTPQRRGLRV